MEKPEISDLITLVGLGMVIAAIALLAGGRWALLTAGLALISAGGVTHRNAQTRRKTEHKP